MKALQQKFGRLDTLTSKLNFFRPQEEEQTEQDERGDALRELAQHPCVRSALIPMFEERIEEIEQEIPRCIESHAKLVALEGRKAEAQTYLKMFKEYIGE